MTTSTKSSAQTGSPQRRRNSAERRYRARSKLRRRFAGLLALGIALVGVGFLYAAFAPEPQTAQAQGTPAQLRLGEQVYNNTCIACHGANLEGIGPVPALAGRSPSYMGRQLFDFQTGARRGLWSDLMKPIVAKMTAEDLVNITAYIASKNPPAADVRQTARAN